MLRPSYSDLLGVLNKDQDNDNIVKSRYTIVISVSKRSRQLIDGAKPLVGKVKVNKQVSIAVQELYESKIKVRNMTNESITESSEMSAE